MKLVFLLKTMLLHVATGAGTTDMLLPAIPILLELSAHLDTAISSIAAHCLATLTEMFPQDAAAGMLSGDGLLLLADALQPAGQRISATVDGPASLGSGSATPDPGGDAAMQEAAGIEYSRQQQLLSSLVAACRFQPPVNILAGEILIAALPPTSITFADSGQFKIVATSHNFWLGNLCVAASAVTCSI